MTLSLRTANLLGAWLAEAFYVSVICIFIFNLIGIPEAGFWLGLFELSMVIPLVVLLRHAARFESPPLYYVQIVCMLLFLLVEAVLDYIYVVDFPKSLGRPRCTRCFSLLQAGACWESRPMPGSLGGT